MLELIDREPAVRDPAEPLARAEGVPAVALERVTARYRSDERPALDGVDLLLEPGRRVALVGPSGAGKTTVTNLLLRFLDPDEGRVTIAGRDLRDYRQEDVRRTFAVAGQDAHVFDSTIRANLLLARPQCRPRTSSIGPSAACISTTGSRPSRTGSTRLSAKTATGSPAASVSG